MQPDFTQTILAWASALLLPGLLFAVALTLLAEWLFNLLYPLVARIFGTPHSALREGRRTEPHFFQPLYTFLKLSGRRAPAHWSPASTTPPRSTKTASNILAFASPTAPILALALLPLPGNPLNRPDEPRIDLLTIFLLIAAGPLFKAASRLLQGGITSLQGAHDLGRLLTGLLPSTIAVAALVEVSATHSLQLTALTAAPETAPQTIVRLLAGAVLLATLPWWPDHHRIASPTTTLGNAPTHAANLLQSVAMSAFWSILILPVVGDRYWAIAITLLGTLFAYLTMRAVPRLWVPVRRQRDAANLVWATALPIAALALLISLWTAS